MAGVVIHPTHTCFDDALDLISDWIKADRTQFERLFLVHGICLNPQKNNEPFSHAWVEREEQCFFVGIIEGTREYLAAPKQGYYRKFKVQEVTRYSVQEALAHNLASGHYGPWLEKYSLLCGDKKIINPP